MYNEFEAAILCGNASMLLKILTERGEKATRSLVQNSVIQEL